MNFDFSKFERNIKKHGKPSEKLEDQSGIGRVVSYIWSSAEIDRIDFNSFSIHDVKYAYEAMECIPLSEFEDNEEQFYCDPQNPFTIQHGVENRIYELYHAENKINKCDDEELFI
ncbi:hypothetical protein [Bacillus sp. AFS040349]|uniref:hypothetical protein n=1 Tax=Bacillus sp. AFS040349 TaxID=2033502 RepID=UPI000BFC45BF|nr:hypothetical protein [Bacillus sp. AFS040349]PGT82198.1 hypothetical protein COD11_15495 [Bacillus sp. AFS040349]